MLEFSPDRASEFPFWWTFPKEGYGRRVVYLGEREIAFMLQDHANVDCLTYYFETADVRDAFYEAFRPRTQIESIRESPLYPRYAANNGTQDDDRIYRYMGNHHRLDGPAIILEDGPSWRFMGRSLEFVEWADLVGLSLEQRATMIEPFNQPGIVYLPVKPFSQVERESREQGGEVTRLDLDAIFKKDQ